MHHWEPQAYKYLLEGDYVNAFSIYEKAIKEEPEVITNYFYLGLIQLLQRQETEAQFTWMACITEQTSSQQIDDWTSELVEILYTEAQVQRANSDYETAWLICQHIHEIDSNNLNNSLMLVCLYIELQTLDVENVVFIELIENLTEVGISPVQTLFNHDLLWELLASLLKYPPHPLLLEFTKACLPFIEDANSFICSLIGPSIEFAYFKPRNDLAIGLLELCSLLSPEYLEVLEHLSAIYQKTGDLKRGLETARLGYELSVNLIDQFFPNSLILRALLDKGGNWQEALSTFATQQSILSSLIAENPSDLSRMVVNRLYTANYFAPYISDEPKLTRSMQNQLSQLCQKNTKVDLVEQMNKFRLRDRTSSQKLKIGYISHGMASHSVGWLARWLIHHHDRDQFQIYGYFQIYRQYRDDLQSWYVSQMDKAYRIGVDVSGECDELADRIYQDQIDILVDLDSITLDGTCGVMAHKPAPIQITWLGSDASGIPAIDYFIADPYVLPDSAQEYYSEKVWRLPQTYIAVDGF